MDTIAQTSLGAMQGRQEGQVVAFRGVPYALPPVGERRFAPPVAAPPWTGTRDATRDGPVAPQATSRLRDAMGDFAAPQDEDCLTLTIWTPGVDAAGRAVLVWLHGGAWVSGAGSLAWYDGGRLAHEQDIVVVGVNYRLGALGFLHAPGISPGNLGTLDEIAALQWVQANVAAVGGDPAKVTLAGQSAGAASIGRLILDPEARPLFRRVILQSGSFGRPPLDAGAAAAIGAAFVGFCGVDPAAADAGARMRALPVAALIEAQGALARSRARFAETTPPFMPHVATPMQEGELIPMIADAARGLDVLIGTTREESHAFFAANPAMVDPPEAAVRGRFVDATGSADAIEEFGRRRPGATAMDLLSDLGTEETFAGPSRRLADAMAERQIAVHAYRFDWTPPGSRFKACHCIELPFVFGTLAAWPDAAMLAGGDPGQMAALSGLLRQHWGAFVRDGAAAWPAYEPAAGTTMIYGELCGAVGLRGGLGA